ncbi:outer membrane lipoprotein-sorting protein [Lysinibacillus sp. BPa_S21]|uniref:LolA family protein n=1 Tax=Lysinibacillus sp. BPa_S21 TaxID=2932478 RepID=UPI002011152C|nr:outer membrane lipoprotein-sorting protein [Lysinibacillus sp. BPa_S21]MCL1694521.1 outer membrane lipoprotein-sorting protein [Lysinibacillus sp. BPa_S21]
MNWKKSLRAAGLVAALTFSLVGCNTEGAYSPQEIIDHALQETQESLAYYAEYTMDMGEVGGKAQVKEWTKDGKRRVEVTSDKGEHIISVNNGSEIISYNVKAKSAFKIDISEDGLESFPSPREQAEKMFDLVKDTHDVSMSGEEKIAGRDTYKLVAKAKKDNTLFGDMEVWVDKKTWLTLKMTTNNAGNKTTTEYTKMDESAKIGDAQFILDIPKDVKVEEVSGAEPESVTLDGVKEQFGEFLMVPEENGLEISNIQEMKIKDRSEFAFEYSQDQQPAFSVSLLKAVEDDTEMGDIPGEEPIEVRNQKGTFMKLGDILTISWQENGNQYNILSENPKLTKEDLLAYAKQMTIVK